LSKKIVKEIPFGEKGDYEGLAIIEQVLYVLRSDGDLFRIEYWEKENVAPTVQQIATALYKKDDAEGLCYDPYRKNLFIACKEDAFLNREIASRSIFKFYPTSLTFDQTPYLSITNQLVLTHIQNHAYQDPLIKELLLKQYQKQTTKAIFRPSGIALEPQTNNMYLLSATAHSLLIFNPQGQLLSVNYIPPTLIPKPEGICFSPKGDLYIASEARKKSKQVFLYLKK